MIYKYTGIVFLLLIQYGIFLPAIGQEIAKVKHAEPLYLDLMRDLGARKGEAEFNVGYGFTDWKDSKSHNAFIEYEWAPINRLGFEVEIPVNLSKSRNTQPSENIEGLKLGSQYTFLVNEKKQFSMAIGYMHEFEWSQRNHNSGFKGMVYAPFFVTAKNFNSFSTLLYISPNIIHHKKDRHTKTLWSVNGSVHYMIPKTNHFIGVENNIECHNGEVDYVCRPQVKIAISHQLAIGVLAGIPIASKNFKNDVMTRVIWEPNF